MKFDGRFKSKLDKYYAEILVYRHIKKLTYKEILQILEDSYNIKTTFSCLYKFLKVREKRKIYPADKKLENAKKRIEKLENKEDYLDEILETLDSNFKASDIFLPNKKKKKKFLSDEEIDAMTEEEQEEYANQIMLDKF